MKRSRKIIASCATLASVALLAGALFACAPQGEPTPATGGEEAAAPSAEVAEPTDVNAWADQFPDQYYSYYRPDYNRSHANLAKVLDTGSEVKYQSFCVACKSSDYNAIYDAHGAEAFDPESSVFSVDGLSADIQDSLKEMWDCATCHEGQPGGAIGSQVSFFNLAAKDFGESVAPSEAVCGQCHNALAAWCEVPDFDPATADPYRYGTDADAILKASKEDGAKSWTDEATGVVTYKGNHAILEMYQGSQHQAMGLGCTDCHMQPTENADGATFTNHDASGQIMYDDLRLDKCLECHTSQDGINTVTDMFYWLRLKQTELTNAQGAAQTKVNDLYDLILNAAENPGTVSDDALAQAKELYSTADFYLEWSSQTYISRNNQIADSRGAGAAHNFDGAMDLYARAGATADEAIALFA